jgi:hypothetical protein
LQKGAALRDPVRVEELVEGLMYSGMLERLCPLVHCPIAVEAKKAKVSKMLFNIIAERFPSFQVVFLWSFFD